MIVWWKIKHLSAMIRSCGPLKLSIVGLKKTVSVAEVTMFCQEIHCLVTVGRGDVLKVRSVLLSLATTPGTFKVYQCEKILYIP